MADEKAQAGIKKLLDAEQEASEVVLAARQGKVERLKQAKVEAEAEITSYKAQREQQFQIFQKERMGDSGAHSKDVAVSTEKELAAISMQVSTNKDKMLEALMQSVTTVAV